MINYIFIIIDYYYWFIVSYDFGEDGNKVGKFSIKQATGFNRSGAVYNFENINLLSHV